MVNFARKLDAGKHFLMDVATREFVLDPSTLVFGHTTWTRLLQFLTLNQASDATIAEVNKAYAAHVMANVKEGMKTNRLRNKEGYFIS